MSQSHTSYYSIPGLVRLRLDHDGQGNHLDELLGLYEDRQAEGKEETVRVTICRHRQEVPALSEVVSAAYKGIPWKLALERQANGMVQEAYFHAQGFVTVLALRIVLIPLIRDLLLQRGGMLVFGSCFRYGDSRFVLCGPPGSGKTSLTLDALRRGAVFVGDGHLLLYANRDIRPLLNLIEIRRATVRRSPLWCYLGARTKLELAMHEAISWATLRKIRLNVCVSPAQLGIDMPDRHPSQSLAIVYLSDSGQRDALPVDRLAGFLVAQAKWYQSLHGTYFSTDLNTEEATQRRNLDALACGSTLWHLGKNASINDILALQDV